MRATGIPAPAVLLDAPPKLSVEAQEAATTHGGRHRRTVVDTTSRQAVLDFYNSV